MHRRMGQPSLVETLLPESLGKNRGLERIGEEVDWERIAHLVKGIYSAVEGRPSYPPLLMVKVLLLEQWYNLSDPQMEEALGDRISFVGSWDWDSRTRHPTTLPSAASGRSWRRGG